MADRNYEEIADALRAQVLALSEERDRLESELAAARRDSERLDWVQKHTDGFGAVPVKSMYKEEWYVVEEYHRRSYWGHDVRSAIDAAIQKGQQ